MNTAGDDSRALSVAKLHALTRRVLGLLDDGVVSTFADGAGVRIERIGAVYWCGPALSALGPALLWAGDGLDVLHLFVDRDSAALARRAEALGQAATVWQVAGAGAVRASPQPLEPEPAPPADIDQLTAVFERHGLAVVAEHGVVMAELLGLEVARIEPHPDGPRIEVGVGRFDREAGALLRGRDQLDDRLADALLEVGPHRRLGADPHPVNRLSRERWLRGLAIDDPALVGLVSLGAVSPAQPRTSLRQPMAAPAVGRGGDGVVALVVFSAGVDLDLVPHAADLVERDRPDRVVFAGLERDQLAPIRTLAERLPVPASFVAMDRPWPL